MSQLPPSSTPAPPPAKPATEAPTLPVPRLRPKKRRRILVAVGAVVLLATGTLLPLWYYGYIPPSVFLSGCEFPGDTGLFPTVNSSVGDIVGGRQVLGYGGGARGGIPSCSVFSAEEPAGGPVTVQMVVENLDNSSAHTITGISVEPPWGLSFVSVPLPILLQPRYNLTANGIEFQAHLLYPDVPGGHFSWTSCVMVVQTE